MEENRSQADEANSSHTDKAQTAVSLTDGVSGDRPETPLPLEKLSTKDLEPSLLRLEESTPQEQREEIFEQPARKVYTSPKENHYQASLHSAC